MVEEETKVVPLTNKSEVSSAITRKASKEQRKLVLIALKARAESCEGSWSQGIVSILKEAHKVLSYGQELQRQAVSDADDLQKKNIKLEAVVLYLCTK